MTELTLLPLSGGVISKKYMGADGVEEGGDTIFRTEGDPLGVLSGETEGELDSERLSCTLKRIGLGEGDSSIMENF